MLIKSFFELITSKASTIDVEDGTDRLNWSVTCKLCLLMVMILAAKTYWSSNIECYNPMVPSGKDFEKYAKAVSWISIMYNRMPSQEDISNGLLSKSDNASFSLRYYMWIPMSLCVAALLIYMPHVLLNYMSDNFMDIELKNIVRKARKMTRDSSVNVRNATEIAESIDLMLCAQREYRTGFFANVKAKAHRLVPLLAPSKRKGTMFTFGYQVTLILYLCVSIAILVGMAIFVGYTSVSEYWQSLLNIATVGDNVNIIPRFPKIVYTLITIKEAHGINTFPTQCVLPINLLWEKMFAVLSLWMMIIVIANVIKLITWWINITRGNREAFVKSLLVKRAHGGPIDVEQMSSFTNEYLKYDGVVILSLMAANSGHNVTSYVLWALWTIFLEKTK